MSVNIDEIVARILAELRQEGLEPKAAADASGPSVINRDGGDLVIDLADPTLDAPRHAMLVDNPYDADGLRNLMATTSARLGVGRAGPRPRTATALLFQADHGVTQDAIYGVVSDEVRDAFDLFTVTTRVADRGEYLLRPDLGRLLSDEGKKLIAERCVKGPDVQLCVVDGLSAAAIDNNLRDIYPVIEQGLKSAGLSVGTPFFIENGRVGIMNDVNSIIKAKVVVLLIGERPGLGIADAMSAYMGFDPQPGKSDADRDLICMITTHGGTNPLEAGAYIVEFIKRMTKYSASGVKLREVAGD
ncbi:MAG TPA: ethanolamine ammonia-lyase subunit EutC [Arachnia sp.]|jgi:ethanolamine ammonia-lyase small subunit|nr:ethanolamine ammonia-lyase subunit EutC [Arachnia sp.]